MISAIIIAPVIGLLAALCICGAVIVRLIRFKQTVADRIDTIAKLLAPDKGHQRNPEQRLVFAQKYVAALRTWIGA